MPVLHEIPFSDFVATRSPRLLHLAYLLTRDRGQAEDLLQTALARAWPVWGRIKDPEAYVRRVMVNTYATWWRRKWNAEVPTEVLPERIGGDPHSGVDAREEMLAALRRLPRQQRAVLILRYYEDLSEVDIADALGISPGTVKSHTQKALAALRLDAALAASVLEQPDGTPPIALSAVMRRVVLRRRRRIAAITAACAVIITIILGYALSPHRRTAPPTRPSPRPQSTAFAPFPEYAGGTRMLDVQELVPGRTITFSWTPNGRPLVLRFRCGTEPAGLILRFRFSLNGGEPWEDGACSPISVNQGGAAISVERQNQAGLRQGAVELSMSLSDTARDGYVSDPSKRATPVPSGTHVIVGFSIGVPWEEYQFPPEQTVPSPDAVRLRMMGQPFITSATDPTRPRSATFEWNDTQLVSVRANAPIDLSVLVNDQPYATCRGWDYSEFACSFDLGPQSRDAHAGLPPARGSKVKVTVVPLHASRPWAVYLMGTMPPLPSS